MRTAQRLNTRYIFYFILQSHGRVEKGQLVPNNLFGHNLLVSGYWLYSPWTCCWYIQWRQHLSIYHLSPALYILCFKSWLSPNCESPEVKDEEGWGAGGAEWKIITMLFLENVPHLIIYGKMLHITWLRSLAAVSVATSFFLDWLATLGVAWTLLFPIQTF